MPSGGKRSGAGRPRKSLVDRIDEGVDKVSHRKPKVMEFPENHTNQNSKNQKSKLPTFLDMSSKENTDDLPTATEIYQQTVEWIEGTGCLKFVPLQLVEDFAFVRRGYLEAESMNRRLGRIVQGGKQSPYVRIAIEYLKQMTALYREIWTIVAQNSTTDFTGNGSNAFLDMLKNRGF